MAWQIPPKQTTTFPHIAVVWCKKSLTKQTLYRVFFATVVFPRTRGVSILTLRLTPPLPSYPYHERTFSSMSFWSTISCSFVMLCSREFSFL